MGLGRIRTIAVRCPYAARQMLRQLSMTPPAHIFYDMVQAICLARLGFQSVIWWACFLS
jgi:hypothetical protein